MGKLRFGLAAGAVAMTVAVVLAFGGAAFAWFSNSTGTVNNSFDNSVVSSQVVEQFDGQTKSSIAVANTGNVPLFCRVRLVAQWVDADGALVGKPAPELDVSLAEGWVMDANGTCYCTQPVAVGEATPNLLAAPLELVADGTCREVVQVLTESIQANPPEAAEQAWGVTVANGVLGV